MSSNQFHFVTRWRFQSSADAIFALLNRPLAFTEWWGTFFQRADVLEKGDEQGIDRLIRFKIRSSILSELNWGYRTLSVIPGHRIDVRISGDFDGDAQWLLEQDGINTDVIFDWNADPQRTLLKEFSGLWRPVIKTSHRWGMEQGRVGLERELLKQERAQREVTLQEPRLLAAKAEPISAVPFTAAVKAKVKGQAAGSSLI